MSQFHLYRYEFSPLQKAVELDLFENTQKDPVQKRKELMEKKQDIFSDFFNDSLENKFNKGKKQYNGKMIFNIGYFFVFRLANKKKIKIERDFTKAVEEDMPSCLVLIDNRKECQKIAIEVDKKAFETTDIACKILASTFKKFLEPYGLYVKIDKMYQAGEFWNYVDLYSDQIRAVKFRFKYPNLPNVHETMSSIIKRVNGNVNSKETEILFKAGKDEYLDIDENNEEIKELARSSADTGSVIDLKIKGVRACIQTGKTHRSFEIDNLEAHLSGNLFYTTMEFLADLFNRVKS